MPSSEQADMIQEIYINRYPTIPTISPWDAQTGLTPSCSIENGFYIINYVQRSDL